MQLQDSTASEISSPNKPLMTVTTAATPPVEAAYEGVNGGEMIGMEVDANSGEEKEREGDEGNKINLGGNRWPRQETLALLKIRSDMDAVFRDSSLKGPLWEEVSRKLAELGYHRSAKKCKEKFENVYKYNKRTKESKSGKSHGKTYKFFDQLQAIENQFTISDPPKSQAILATTTNIMTLPTRQSDGKTTISHATTTFPSINPTAIFPSPRTNATVAAAATTTTSITNPRNPSPPQASNNINNNVPHSLPNMNNLFSTITTSASTSSSTASDDDLEERYQKKRKWKDYFRRLTRKVLVKQEEMQNKFLEALDKRERERMAQQDSWRMQEMAKINKDHEILVQERSTAAAKDAGIIALLQKLSGQQSFIQLSSFLSPSSPLISQVEPPQHKQIIPQTQPPILLPNNNFQTMRMNNGHSATSTTTTSLVRSSSSRWPKAEVHALIKIRTSLETKYQENGPKAPLWEEISCEMQRHGYNRSAKRCKEKWENINKYFKKMKDSNRERREDSKTCPYFHELDALYKLKSKSQNPFGISFHNMKPNEMMMMMEPLMVQPEQQWRPPPQSLKEGVEKETTSEYHEKEEQDEEKEDGDDDDAEEYGDSVEDEGTNRHEIGTNN